MKMYKNNVIKLIKSFLASFRSVDLHTMMIDDQLTA